MHGTHGRTLARGEVAMKRNLQKWVLESSLWRNLDRHLRNAGLQRVRISSRNARRRVDPSNQTRPLHDVPTHVVLVKLRAVDIERVQLQGGAVPQHEKLIVATCMCECL